MKETDSRECRNCHKFQHMNPEAIQKQSVHKQHVHAKAFKQGETCIDCHKGIAHHLPQGYEEEQEQGAGT